MLTWIGWGLVWFSIGSTLIHLNPFTTTRVGRKLSKTKEKKTGREWLYHDDGFWVVELTDTTNITGINNQKGIDK